MVLGASNPTHAHPIIIGYGEWRLQLIKVRRHQKIETWSYQKKSRHGPSSHDSIISIIVIIIASGRHRQINMANTTTAMNGKATIGAAATGRYITTDIATTGTSTTGTATASIDILMRRLLQQMLLHSRGYCSRDSRGGSGNYISFTTTDVYSRGDYGYSRTEGS